MKEKILIMLGGKIVQEFLEMIPREKVIKAMGHLIDGAEEHIASTETKADDVLILPVLKFVREVLSVPDINS